MTGKETLRTFTRRYLHIHLPDTEKHPGPAEILLRCYIYNLKPDMPRFKQEVFATSPEVPLLKANLSEIKKKHITIELYHS